MAIPPYAPKAAMMPPQGLSPMGGMPGPMGSPMAGPMGMPPMGSPMAGPMAGPAPSPMGGMGGMGGQDPLAAIMALMSNPNPNQQLLRTTSSAGSLDPVAGQSAGQAAQLQDGMMLDSIQNLLMQQARTMPNALALAGETGGMMGMGLGGGMPGLGGGLSLAQQLQQGRPPQPSLPMQGPMQGGLPGGTMGGGMGGGSPLLAALGR